MIEAKGLTKVFGGKNKMYALADVELEAAPKSATALVGPNGAGKTTLIKILSTLVLPTSGDALVNGYSIVREPAHVRKSIGLVTVSERLFYYRLSALENMVFYGSLYDMSLRTARERSLELLSMVGLSGWADTKTMHYSTGMLRRLALARALLHDPPVIMLDEPTLGIDVVSSRSLRKIVRELAEEKTVLFTSHYMKDVEEIADRIYMIKEGRILERGSPSELLAMAGTFAEVNLPDESIPAYLRKYVIASDGPETRVRLPEASLAELGANADVVGKMPATLEDVYVSMVGESGMDVRLHQVKRGGGGRE